jgi:hypothetical protein
MSTATLETVRTSRQHFAAESIDDGLGVIRRCTVLKANVPALGKSVLLNSKGEITSDPKLAVKKLPIFTDSKTLDTLLAAAKTAGNRVKTRENHDDSVGARAGFTDAFSIDGDRVAGDVHLFKAYKNRALVLETAAKTPDDIGLSIDFVPSYEIDGGRALMRVSELIAVDIVDEGAVTPDGLLLSAGVDNSAKMKTNEFMADPTLSDLMTAVQQCTSGYAALAKQLNDHGAALAKLTAPAAKPNADADNDGMSAIKQANEKLAAELKTVTEQLSTISSQATSATQAVANFKKERALLGFKGTELDRVKLAAVGSAEDIEKLNAETKTYTQLVDETVAREKCSRSNAHAKVQKTAEGKLAYSVHLSSKGVVRTTA